MLPTLDELLLKLANMGASDLHLTVGSPPYVRLDGTLVALEDMPVLTPETTRDLVYSVLTSTQIARLEGSRNLDISYALPHEGPRFRGNMMWARGAIGAVFRAVPAVPPNIDLLGLPPVLKELATRPRGLVLVTGPSGSGKSTTLAAVVEYLNKNYRRHIVTIEDPIEYVHHNHLSLVRQREVGVDVESFSDALKYVLRQDPDVIVVGEMRDLETMSLAMSAAETGHLVLGTLHTMSAQTTVERVIDVFPPTQQAQMRIQLSSTLQAVLCQALLPHVSGRGRVCATEVLLAVPSVRTLIREGQHHRLINVIETGARFGMFTLNQSLRDLVVSQKVTLDAALAVSSDPDALQKLVELSLRN